MFASFTEQGPLTRAFVFTGVSSKCGCDASCWEVDVCSVSWLSSGFGIYRKGPRWTAGMFRLSARPDRLRLKDTKISSGLLIGEQAGIW